MKVKDRYWEVENSIRFANPEKATRPLLCGPKVFEDGVRIRLWLRDLTGTGTGGAIVLLSRHEAAVMANAINTRSNWIGEKTSDMPRIGVSVTKKYTEAQAAEIDKQKALNEQQVAKTEAETKKIKAQGEADANAVLNESLTDNVLKQHYIDALSNADQLVVVPDGADTLVQTK